jgi:aryl-alcohol dehydrogenase-like predicted oxidoreductase
MEPTEEVPLGGGTGLTVTRVGLGTAALGGLYEVVADEAARATIERAWELGLRFFDTAPLYGHGLSEERLGAALACRPRGDFVLATKVGRLLRAGAPPDDSQLSGARSRRAWSGSASTGSTSCTSTTPTSTTNRLGVVPTERSTACGWTERSTPSAPG